MYSIYKKLTIYFIIYKKHISYQSSCICNNYETIYIIRWQCEIGLILNIRCDVPSLNMILPPRWIAVFPWQTGTFFVQQRPSPPSDACSKSRKGHSPQPTVFTWGVKDINHHESILMIVYASGGLYRISRPRFFSYPINSGFPNP